MIHTTWVDSTFPEFLDALEHRKIGLVKISRYDEFLVTAYDYQRGDMLYWKSGTNDTKTARAVHMMCEMRSFIVVPGQWTAEDITETHAFFKRAT